MNKSVVLNGIDRLDDADKYLSGKRVGLLTNASGVNKYGVPSYAVISEKYALNVLFAPEHGIRTNLQDGGWMPDMRDSETGLPIYTLSSKKNEHICDALSLADVIVYDIQDVGARFYTYLYNLTGLMRIVAEYPEKSILVLDRINPIGGARRDGITLDESVASSHIGEYAVPTRYGLTVGEFAKFINEEKHIGCRLDVLPCEGWRRDMYADETDLLWVNPSPNINGVNCAINYIGTCIFEATNISEGRGTTSPFSLVGAPFVNSARLCAEMTALHLPGVVFRRAYFTPMFGKHAGIMCEGTELHITDREAYSPIVTMLYLYRHMNEYKEFTCRESGFVLRYGNKIPDFDNIPGELERVGRQCEAFGKLCSKHMIY